jgi:TPR repeat protein
MSWIRGLFKAIAIVILLSHVPSFAADKATDNGAECFKRAERYEKEAKRYGNDVRDPTKWFDLAMKYYLCAAKAGNAMAMLRAVEISHSETSDSLPKEEEDKLLLQAAEANLPAAQVALANEYCDDYGTRPSCKNPVEAQRWLLKAAKNGSAWGAFDLGYIYETEPDSSDLKSLAKALACYRLSLQRHQDELQIANKKEKLNLKSQIEIVERGIGRIERKLEGKPIQAVCYE